MYKRKHIPGKGIFCFTFLYFLLAFPCSTITNQKIGALHFLILASERNNRNSEEKIVESYER